MRALVAIPVFNEQTYVTRVLEKVRRFAPDDILVIDDGSTDDTPLLVARQPVEAIRHAVNRGYGQCMIDAFRWAQCYRFDWLITMDCDEQHEPESLPDFLRAIEAGGADIISGSRYLERDEKDDSPPRERREINRRITELVRETLGLNLTDAFCGFKAYRVGAMKKLQLDEAGYAFPLQFWVQAAAYDLKVAEIPIRLIYNDPNRTFGGVLDDSGHRLGHYLSVFDRELRKFPHRFEGICVPCAATKLGPSRQGCGVEETSEPARRHA